MDPHARLSRRERQIMDIVWPRGRATAAEVEAAVPERLSNASVRTFLRNLEAKGCLRHTREGREFVYRPARPRSAAARSALRRVLSTFFGGSLEKALALYLSEGRRGRAVDPDELRRLSDLIDRARKG